MGKLLRLLQVLFSVCESAKAIVFLKFPLKSGPSYAIVREKTNFTDGHVHVLSIFVKKKKLFSCTVLTRENCKTARERGKMLSKVSLHMHCPYSCAPSTKWGKSTVCLGEFSSGKTTGILFCTGR